MIFRILLYNVPFQGLYCDSFCQKQKTDNELCSSFARECARGVCWAGTCNSSKCYENFDCGDDQICDSSKLILLIKYNYQRSYIKF